MKQRNKLFITLIGALLYTLIIGVILPNVAAATKTKFSCHTTETALFVGKSYEIYCYGSDEKNYKATDVTYTSSNPKVATVSSDGIVTGTSFGDVTITVTSNSNTKQSACCKLHFYQDVITIGCKTSSFTAGQTYQLTANQKNVIWSLNNIIPSDSKTFTFANASIDSKTGKVKTRNCGKLYIYARTLDGKYFGSTYVDCTGPIISPEGEFEPIILKKDMGIVDFATLKESGLLPKTIELNYTDGEKSGTVECEIDWHYANQNTEFTTDETYIITPSLIIPEGYTLAEFVGASKLKCLQFSITKKQTDHRSSITEFKDIKITLSKDTHIQDARTFLNDYFIKQGHTIVGIDADGNEVPFNVCSFSGLNDSISLNKKGTYTDIRLIPAAKTGYINDNNLSASLTLIVKKKQTAYEDPTAHLTLDDIAQTKGDYLTSTQSDINRQ